jgi:hypothetical protein
MANANDTPKLFFASIKRWHEKTQATLLAIARQSAFELAERVVVATPVDTGFLRGSWQPSIGGPAKFGGGAFVIAAVVQQIKLGDVFMLRNNAAYAMRIEFGFVGTDKLGRHYNQKGRYMVTDNCAKWKTIVADIARQLK